MSILASTTPEIELWDAPAPFNDQKADFILQSSDGVLFHTYKLLLSKASSHFANMFSLPPVAPSPTAPPDSIDGVPVVAVTEKADEIGRFLSFCHPDAPKPSPQTPYEAFELHRVGDKYVSDTLLLYVRRELSRLAVSHPVGAFMVAFHLGYAEEAAKAARESLKMTPEALSNAGGQEMEVIPAGVLQKLSNYRRQCELQVTQVTLAAFWYGLDVVHREDPHPYDEVYLFKYRPIGTWEHKFPSKCCCRKSAEPPEPRFWEHNFTELMPINGGAYNILSLGWFETYLHALRLALLEAPGREDIYHPRIMAGALMEAQRCPECWPHALDVMCRVSDELKEGSARSFLNEVPTPSS